MVALNNSITLQGSSFLVRSHNVNRDNGHSFIYIIVKNVFTEQQFKDVNAVFLSSESLL